MKKLFGIIIIGSVLISCKKEVTPSPCPGGCNQELLITSAGDTADIDANGYYHLKLDRTKNQTVHRVNGTILVNGKEPYPAEKVEWESNLYWWFLKGQVVAEITKTYVNYFTGKVTYVNLPPLVNWQDALVPTINPVCYNSADGTINTVIAPMWSMKGDTMTILARIGSVIKTEKIILK